MTTGERMKQRRKEIGLSAEKVAERLGVSPATIYRYEKGDIEKVPVDIFAELAKILQTTPAYLMGWEEKPEPKKPTIPPGFEPMPKMKKIRKLYGEKAQMTADNLKALRELEKKNICDIDKSAGFFGRIMAELFVCREDEWAEKLRKMGFYFGKFIYLMDAYEDIEEDLKQNRYNPLAELYGQESFEENCQQILKMMMAETSRVFEQLPIVEEVEILRNILYAGVWSRYGQIRCSRKGTDKKE